MFCKNCGKKVNVTEKFCGVCGHLSFSNEKHTISDENQFSYSPEMEQSNLVLIEHAKKVANTEMVKGVGWAGIGLLITFITYSMASDGGTYFVFWGLVIYGAYIFLRGLFWRISPRSLVDKALSSSEEEH